jgi:hypothetical protein
MSKRGDGRKEWSLGWRRISPFKDCFELRAESRVLATLAVGGLAITSAEVDAGGRRLVFRAEGVGSQRIRILDAAEGGVVVATFDRHWSGRAGTLRFLRGGQLGWRRVGYWRPMYVFSDRFGNPLVRYRPDGSVVDCVVGDEFALPIGSWSDLLLLLALGWFLLIISGQGVPPELEVGL